MTEPDNKHEEELTAEEEEAWARSWKKGSDTWLNTEKELREAHNNKSKSSRPSPTSNQDEENERP